MEEYTREQIQRADDTDLYVFLSGRGEQFKRCGKEYRWLRHDSVMINKNEWYRFSQNKGGHAIDFMKEFYGLSFAEAVKELLGEEGVGETNRRTAKEDAGRQRVCPIPLPGLELPERNESCEIARKYLIEQRKLSEHLVDQMIEKGDIYESKAYHNVVFVGRDKEQNPRYFHRRLSALSTLLLQQRSSHETRSPISVKTSCGSASGRSARSSNRLCLGWDPLADLLSDPYRRSDLCQHHNPAFLRRAGGELLLPAQPRQRCLPHHGPVLGHSLRRGHH